MNYSDYLAHHGIKGQKWGVRRYQNPDGSYTNAGRKRYAIDEYKNEKKAALDRLNRGTENLKKSGRGNDRNEVKKLASQYDRDLARAKVRKNLRKEGSSNYELHYDRFGGTSIRDTSTGKKMSRGTTRALEKQLKANDVQKYREYQRYKKTANSGMTYVGNNASVAMMASMANAASKGSRDSAKVSAQKMLIEYGNINLSELNKKR